MAENKEEDGEIVEEPWSIFEGSFLEDKIHNKGLLEYSNGDIYRGSFRNGIRNGKGKLKL